MSYLSTIRSHTTPRKFLIALSLIIGLLSGLAANLLKNIIYAIEHILTRGFDTTDANWLYLVYPIAGIALSALFIRYIVKDNIGHGVTKILYALSRKSGFLARHNTWSSVVASGITIGFGGSVGAESPIVLTGSAIGSTIGHASGLSGKTLMTLIGCGAAGAIAGIFKAPIAGIVFTIEVLMLDITMMSLLPLLVSCATATCVSYFLTGIQPMFPFELQDSFKVGRIPSSILLGIFCGFISLYFTKVMTSLETIFARIPSMYGRILLGGTIIAALIYFFPPLYGEGYSTITTLLSSTTIDEAARVMNNSLFYGHNQHLITFLLLIILVKVFATTATNGGGGCGGTFAPSLFLGCIGGYAFAHLWNQYFPSYPLPVANYALLGMAGVMSGVFHAPLTGIFLIAELTGGYDLLVPLMIVSAASYLTIYAFQHHNIYAIRLARRGELLTHHKDQSVLTLLTLESFIDRERPVFYPDTTLGDIVHAMSNNRHFHFAVIDRGGQFLGMINLNDIRQYIFRSELYRQFNASQLLHQPRYHLVTDDPMTTVMDKFQQATLHTLPVLQPDGTFVGFVAQDTILEAYRETMKDFSEE